MIGIGAALFLMSMLLLVHFSTKDDQHEGGRAREVRPLDQDYGLLLPWAGHASNVFSLTALFGGYTVIAAVLGVPALLGLATGGVAALIFMRRVIVKEQPHSFHSFLASRQFSPEHQKDDSYWLLLISTQLLLAISEVVILREVALHAFDLTPAHATIFAIGLALVAYFYSLIGKYDGIFRTDVLQLLVMILMCVVAASYAAFHVVTSTLNPNNVLLEPLQSDSWVGSFPFLSSAPHPTNFAIGAIAGSSLLLASPDTWKRIYLTSGGDSTGASRSFWGLVLAGAVPFVLLLPALLIMPRPSLDNPEVFAPLHATINDHFLLLSITLGMMASFLSTFDGALISSTHLLMARAERTPAAPNKIAGIAHFHLFLGVGFLVIFSGSLFFILGTGNPYLPGVVVLGMYAILGGTVVGTKLGSCVSRDLKTRSIGSFWPPVIALALWFALVVSFDDIIYKPVPEQLLLVPAAAGMYLLFALLAHIELRRVSK